MSLSDQIPVGLMEILNQINNNINEVKERLARLETHEHGANIQRIWEELKIEREKRAVLELTVERFKTTLAPLIAAISMVGAVLIQNLIKVS